MGRSRPNALAAPSALARLALAVFGGRGRAAEGQAAAVCIAGALASRWLAPLVAEKTLFALEETGFRQRPGLGTALLQANMVHKAGSGSGGCAVRSHAHLWEAFLAWRFSPVKVTEVLK